MKTFTVIITFSFLSLISQAQGISFEQNQNWEQIKQKAIREKKYLFVDLYATWCAPCKAMDSEVYQQEKIGQLMNKNFICVKVQIDKTSSDSKEIKNWYQDAEKISKEYKVSTLPAYLFFSPEGNVVTKVTGYKDPSAFIKMTNDALEPKNQYYTLLESYKNGKFKKEELPELAKKSRSVGEEKESLLIAEDYINNYLLKLNQKELFVDSNLVFIGAYLGDRKTQGFIFYKENIDRINSIIGPNRAEYSIRSAIAKYTIPNDELWIVEKPNWDSLEKEIANNYGTLGLEEVYGQRMIYSYTIKDWQNFGKYYSLYFQTALKRPEYNVNSISFEIFNYVNDISVLNFACSVVMKYAMEEWYPNNAAAYDTYANLLYRTGRKQDAIAWETKAIKMAIGTPYEKQFLNVIEKMKKDEPTWSAQNDKI